MRLARFMAGVVRHRGLSHTRALALADLREPRYQPTLPHRDAARVDPFCGLSDPLVPYRVEPFYPSRMTVRAMLDSMIYDKLASDPESHVAVLLLESASCLETMKVYVQGDQLNAIGDVL